MDFGFSHLSWNVVLFWPLRATVHIWTATWNILSIHLLKHNEKCLLFCRRCQMTAHKGAACLTVMYDAQSSRSVSVWGNQTADIVKIILCHIAPEQSCDSPRGNKTESSLRVKSFMWLFSSQSSSGEAVFNSTGRNLQCSDTNVIIIFRIIFPVIQPPAWQEGSRDIVLSPHQHLQRCSICVLKPPSLLQCSHDINRFRPAAVIAVKLRREKTNDAAENGDSVTAVPSRGFSTGSWKSDRLEGMEGEKNSD